MILTFTFSIDPESSEATFAGTIEPMQALQILQSIVVAEAVKKAGQEGDKPDTIEESVDNE